MPIDADKRQIKTMKLLRNVALWLKLVTINMSTQDSLFIIFFVCLSVFFQSQNYLFSYSSKTEQSPEISGFLFQNSVNRRIGNWCSIGCCHGYHLFPLSWMSIV